jgi:Domain of unknown function (DUF5122) beta-propeller
MGSLMRRCFLIVVLGLGVTVIVAPSAFALGNLPDTTWRTNGPVRAMTRIGNTIYMGGNFTALVSPSGQKITVSNFAAIDAQTGEPITTWKPTADGVVWTLDNDGARVIAGGDFLNVNGTSRTRLAAIDATTGALDAAWMGKASGGSVRAVSVNGAQIYVGGMFTTVDGKTRTRMAALNPDGSLSSTWTNPAFTSPAGINGATGSISAAVRNFGYSPDRSQLYVVGDFYAVNGAPRVHIARMDPTTGVLDSWAPNEEIFQIDDCDLLHTRTICDWAQNITTIDGRIFVGMCGGKNRIDALDPVSGNRVWRLWTSGDVKSQTQWGGNIIIGGHFHQMHKEGDPNFIQLQFLAKLDYDGNPDPTWKVKIDNAQGTYDGMYALLPVGDGPGSYLWVGGAWQDKLHTFNNQSYLARFTY